MIVGDAVNAVAALGVTGSGVVAAWRGPPNNFYTWLVLLSFNIPILAIVACVPFGQRLGEALREKTPDGLGMTSYSRVTGALGAVILTAFFWAIGNVTLMDALGNRGGITQLLDAVSRFFLVGSALFLPYAFNQLKSLFPWSAGVNAALLSSGNSASNLVGSTAPTQLTIANLSSLSDAQVQAAIRGIQTQVNNEFGREWRVAATLGYRRLDPKIAATTASADAIIYLGDRASDPNAGNQVLAGYHTHAEGQAPYGFVYLDVCRQNHAEWTVMLSHEVLELLADPTAVLKIDGPHPRAPEVTVQYAQEVCDAVQADIYLSDGVKVCNFVTRAFFGLPGGSPKLNHLGRPQERFKTRPGGYLTWFDDVGGHELWSDETPVAQQAARLRNLDLRRNGRRFGRLPPDRRPEPPPVRQSSARKLISKLRRPARRTSAKT